MATAIHTTTQPNVIRRFLLLQEGDTCDELRRAESERILRAQPFIADVAVRALADSAGAVTLDVRTTDEVALVFGIAVGAGNPHFRLLKVGDANLAGEGSIWPATGATADRFGTGMAGDSSTTSCSAARTSSRPRDTAGPRRRVGDRGDAPVLHRHPAHCVAWSIRRKRRLRAVHERHQLQSGIRVRRNFRRRRHRAPRSAGSPGLFGASISGDDERPSELRSSSPATASPGHEHGATHRYITHRIARINALWGVRDIGFVPVLAFDALTATQDLPVGFQLERCLDAASPCSAPATTTSSWRAICTSARSERTTRCAFSSKAKRAEEQRQHAMGWPADERAPSSTSRPPSETPRRRRLSSAGAGAAPSFNLTLRTDEMAVCAATRRRTRPADNASCGWRIATSSDDPTGSATGVGVFADAGRLWAGDPLRVNTPVRSSLGISLLAAAPPASARCGEWTAYARNPEVTAAGSSCGSAAPTRRRSSSPSRATFRRRARRRFRRACFAGRGRTNS